MILNAELINKQKLVSCYLKKKGLELTEREKFDNMPMSELEDLITSEYEIKGKLSWESLQKAKKNTDVPLEKDEQKSLCKWLRENKIGHFATGLGMMIDGGYKYAASLKATGFYSGIPDLVVLLGYKTLFIELKRVKGGRVSDKQQKWIEWLNSHGYPAKVCKGCNEAIEFIEQERKREK